MIVGKVIGQAELSCLEPGQTFKSCHFVEQFESLSALSHSELIACELYCATWPKSDPSGPPLKISSCLVPPLNRLPNSWKPIGGDNLVLTPSGSTTHLSLSKGLLHRKTIRHKILSFCRLRFTHFDSCDLRDVVCVKSDLTGCWFDGSLLQRATFVKCDLTRCSFRATDLREASFIYCTFKGALLDDHTILSGELAEQLKGGGARQLGPGADLRDVDLRKAGLHDLDLRGADFTGADLRGALLRNTLLTDAIITKNQLESAKVPQC